MTDNTNMSTSECENCHAVLQGDFCHKCGQARKTNLLAFNEFVLTLLGGLLSYDSKVNRTLIPLIAKPGAVCNEYLHGHRARFIAPMKLYLFCSVIFFLLMPLLGDININASESESIHDEFKQALQEDEDLKGLADGVNSGISINLNDSSSESDVHIDFLSEEQNAFFKERLQSMKKLEGDDYAKIVKDNLPGIMFFMLPLLALILKITNIFKGRLYSEHFVVALYAQSYVFIVMCLLSIFEAAGEYFTFISSSLLLSELWSAVVSVGFVWMMVHLFLMQKRIYKQSWKGGIAQYFFNMLLYTIMFTVVFVMALLWDIVTL